MNKYLLYILLLTIVACSDENNKEQTDSKLQDTVYIKRKRPEYRLIRDDLYSDGKGDLYLKSVNNEDLEGGTQYDVWLTSVWCDTCWISTDDGWIDTKLKDFVDTNSFRFDSTDLERGGSIYVDKNYKYFHKWMADGGTISLIEK